MPGIVEKYMGKVNAKLGTNYQLSEYYGVPDADRVIIAMGSICDVAGRKSLITSPPRARRSVLVKVRQHRPFTVDKLLAAIPATAKKLPCWTAHQGAGALGRAPSGRYGRVPRRGRVRAPSSGGRYGLGSKDTPPSSVFAVYEELAKDAPEGALHWASTMTSPTSLEEKPAPNTAAEGTVECKILGPGRRRHGRRQQEPHLKIIGDHTDKYIQALLLVCHSPK